MVKFFDGKTTYVLLGHDIGDLTIHQWYQISGDPNKVRDRKTTYVLLGHQCRDPTIHMLFFRQKI